MILIEHSTLKVADIWAFTYNAMFDVFSDHSTIQC